MTEYLPDLVARLRLDTTEIEQGASRSAMIGGAIGGALGAAAVAGLSMATDAIKEFIGGSVDAYSELEDSTAAAGVIFGDAMGTIIAQSETAAQTLGLSSQQVINAANTFGTYGKAAGLVGEDLAGFSTELTGLAGDLASFKGTSTEQAIEAIGGALRGEFEPMRAYGVLLDEAALQQAAFAAGITDSIDTALTPQQKALAASQAILAQTADAQGDFARTADSTANTQKRLASEAANTQAAFGTLLAPAFTMIREVAISALGGINGAIDEWIPKVEGIYARVQPAFAGLRDLFANGDYTGALREGLGVEEDSPFVAFVLGMRDTVVGLIPQISAAFAPIGTAVSAILPALAPLIPQVLQLASAFSPLGLILDVVVPLLPMLSGAIATVVQTVSGALSVLLPVILQVASLLVGALIDAIMQLLPAVLSLLPAISMLVAQLGPVLGQVIAALAPILLLLVDAIVQLLPPILSIITPVLQLVGALLPLVGVVADLIGELLPPLIDLFVALLQPILALVGEVIAALVPAIESLLPPIEQVIGLLSDWLLAIMPITQAILGAVIGALSALIGWLANVVAAVVRFVAGTVSGLVSFVSAVGDGIGRAIQWFRDLPNMIAGALAGLAGRLVGFGRDAIQGFIDGIRGMAGRVIDAIKSTVTDALPSFVKKALGIASPSRLFRQFGRDTGEGFALGLEDMSGRLAGAAQDMAGTVSSVQVAPPSLGSSAPAFAAAANPSGAGLTGGGNVIVPQVRVYIGDEEITSRVRVEVVDVLAAEATAIAAGSAD